MNEASESITPMWFFIVSALFLIWNVFGLAVFVMAMTKYRKPEALEAAGLSEQQIELTLATPTWVNIAFGVAVVFGVLGCIALLAKMSLAVPLLCISLAGVVVQNTYMYFLSDTVKIMGTGASPFVIAGAIALIPYALYCANSGWFK